MLAPSQSSKATISKDLIKCRTSTDPRKSTARHTRLSSIMILIRPAPRLASSKENNSGLSNLRLTCVGKNCRQSNKISSNQPLKFTMDSRALISRFWPNLTGKVTNICNNRLNLKEFTTGSLLLHPKFSTVMPHEAPSIVPKAISELGLFFYLFTKIYIQNTIIII